MKITKRGREAFEYYSACQDTKRLPAIPCNPDGVTACEAFFSHETHGVLPPCREPELLARALNGKAWHGVTVANLAEDYVGRILFADELKAYPAWIRKEVLALAAKYAMRTLGFVPLFVSSGEDFTTLSDHKP